VRLLHSFNFSDILLGDLFQGLFSFKLHGNSLIKFLLTIHLDGVSFSSSLGSDSLVLGHSTGDLFSNGGFFFDNSCLNLDLLRSLNK